MCFKNCVSSSSCLLPPLFTHILVSPSGRVGSSQVCRPHFHSPLHPWISDGKGPMVPHPAHHTAPSWHFPSKPSSHAGSAAGMVQAASHSSPHLFSFPPTPPKDATPDNLSANHAHSASTGHDFGSALGIVSSAQDAQLAESKAAYTNSLGTWGSLSSGSSSSKPREGNSSFSSALNHQSAHHPASIPYHHHHPAHYGSAPTSGADFGGGGAAAAYGAFAHHSPHTASSMFSSSKSGQSSQHSSSKSRSKGRSSAGKSQSENLISRISLTILFANIVNNAQKSNSPNNQPDERLKISTFIFHLSSSNLTKKVAHIFT